MPNHVEIENIEAMRQAVGIHDVELQQGIRHLRVGDLVKLTLLTGQRGAAGVTVLVRITRIRGSSFRGELTKGPASSNLQAGSSFRFTRSHIHSLGGIARLGGLSHAE
jgi:hypothetical protein